jgi:hypothetical protein
VSVGGWGLTKSRIAPPARALSGQFLGPSLAVVSSGHE